MRFLIAAVAVMVLVGPVVWATVSKRGRVLACCTPGDASMDKRMSEIDARQGSDDLQHADLSAESPRGP